MYARHARTYKVRRNIYKYLDLLLKDYTKDEEKENLITMAYVKDNFFSIYFDILLHIYQTHHSAAFRGIVRHTLFHKKVQPT